MNSVLMTAAFWIATGERAVKTFAQSAVALLTGGYTGLLDVDFKALLSIAGLATLVSVLTSIASVGGPVGGKKDEQPTYVIGGHVVPEATYGEPELVDQVDTTPPLSASVA